MSQLHISDLDTLLNELPDSLIKGGSYPSYYNTSNAAHYSANKSSGYVAVHSGFSYVVGGGVSGAIAGGVAGAIAVNGVTIATVSTSASA